MKRKAAELAFKGIIIGTSSWKTLIFVNNSREGNALETIEAMVSEANSNNAEDTQ